jgi:uncharacterized membrane protein
VLKVKLRVPRAEMSRTPLWLWPAAVSVLALGAAVWLTSVRLGPSKPALLSWPGDTDSALTMLQTVAGSVITVTGLTFTLTVVALQLASQQFSPRLLREFSRDRTVKIVLSVLVATFVYTTTVLRQIHADQPLPGLALLVASILGLAALTAVLAFITHIARILRVDTMMRTVHAETNRAIATFYPEYGDPRPRSPDELALRDEAGACLYAPASGFVRVIDVPKLVRLADERDVLLRIEVRPGDHVVRHTPAATVWSREGDHLDVDAIQA